MEAAPELPGRGCVERQMRRGGAGGPAESVLWNVGFVAAAPAVPPELPPPGPV